MRICIIGGGLCGLVAGMNLSRRHEVDLVEKHDHLGGCLASYRIGEYWVERFYHHCFENDRFFFALLQELEIADKLEWLTGSTGYMVDGHIHPLTTPFEILRYPHLSLADKARLALLTKQAGRMDVGELDDVTAKEFIVGRLGEQAYASFFEPLIRSKFGSMQDSVSAAWLISRIAIRSNRGMSGERLGYMRGGFVQVIDRLAERCVRHGCRVRTGTRVESVKRNGSTWLVNEEPYDVLLSTIPPQELNRMGGPDMPPIPYQGALCVTLGLDRDVTNGIYWLNMRDPAPYGAVISHTNFVPMDRYGEHIVYLGSYFSGDHPPGRIPSLVTDFCNRFGVKPSAVRWQHAAVERYAGPVFTTGYKRLIPDYEQHGLYMAGMFSKPNYPERSMEGSVIAARDAVQRIERGMKHG